MAARIHTATKTRSNRPGWSVTFRHPRRKDTRSKFGRKVRRGLGTPDDAQADQLVGQLNEILADPSWWSLDRQAEAKRRFDPVVVSAFFDDIEVGKINSKELREEMLPLPTPDDGYARVHACWVDRSRQNHPPSPTHRLRPRTRSIPLNINGKDHNG